MIEGKTKSGFEYKVPEENFDNYELLEVLGEIEEKPQLMTKAVAMMLGTEQKEELKNHLRSKSGVVSVEKISNEIMEIFESQKEAKNS